MEKGSHFVEIRLVADDSESGRAYNDLYEETSLAQIQSFYLWLMEYMRLPTQGRLLDVSCGSGDLVRLAGQHGLEAVGVDISEVAARSASRNVGSSASIGVSVGEHLPFPDRCFDFVTNIGSLEHYVSPAQGVREMARVLRPGGQAFVLLPNTFSLLSNIWLAYRKGITPADPIQPIQRYGARMDWERLIESNGLRVCRRGKYERSWPRIPADWGYYLRRPKEMVRLVASPFIPLNLAWCFLFTCELAG